MTDNYISKEQLMVDVNEYIEDATNELKQQLEHYVANALSQQSDTMHSYDSDISLSSNTGSASLDRITRGTANSATRQVARNGSLNVRRLANGILRRTGRALGESVADNIFGTQRASSRASHQQLGADIFDGLIKSQRNR